MTRRQEHCLERAHKAWMTVLDERIEDDYIVFDVHEHRPSAPMRSVSVHILSGQVHCSCPQAAVCCEHCCYVLLYELDLGMATITEDTLLQKKLTHVDLGLVVQWVKHQLGREILFASTVWPQDIFVNTGSGSTHLPLEHMHWPSKLRGGMPTLLTNNPQERILLQATRHLGRGGGSKSDLFHGRLLFTIRELRRRVVTVCVELSRGTFTCSCHQSRCSPTLWCQHCCSVALELLPAAAAGAAVAARSLTPEQALHLYIAHGGLQQKDSLLMRGADLRGSECAICISDIEPTAIPVMCSDCRVGYHAQCMVKWLSNANPATCPTCRKVISVAS